MAIPFIPYEGPRFSDLLGIARVNLETKLAQEKMAMDDARERQLAAQNERNRERQHQQQMAQFGLQEMKFNYEQQQDQPGGLEYARVMAGVGQTQSATAENLAQAEYYRRRTSNPELFRSPGAAPRITIKPLTAAQQKANADAMALGQPPIYQPTVTSAPANSYGTPYDQANVNDPNDPALLALQDSLVAGMNGAPMPGEDPYTPVAGTPTTGPAANDPLVDLPYGSPGGPDDSLLNPGDMIGTGPTGQGPLPSRPPQPAQAQPPAGQGPLPMDPESVQRRQAMESARIKEESAVSKALNDRRDAARARILAAKANGEDGDPIAETELQQVERELKQLLQPPPKATAVKDEQGIIEVTNGNGDPFYQVGNRNFQTRGQAEVFLETGEDPAPPAAQPAPAQETAAPPEPARPGIGIIPKAAGNPKQSAANEFWTDGKSQAARLANLSKATDDELRMLRDGSGPTDPYGITGISGEDPYSKVLADKIKDRFNMPAGSDDPAIRGRKAKVTAEDFLRAAARDELARRNAGQPASGLSDEKVKQAMEFDFKS